MKLEIKEHCMKIVTENIQDVVYLKNMGLLKDNNGKSESEKIRLECSVVKKKREKRNGICENRFEIDIRWTEAGLREHNNIDTEFIQCAVKDNEIMKKRY